MFETQGGTRNRSRDLQKNGSAFILCSDHWTMCLFDELLCLLRGCIAESELGLISLCLHCFLRLSQALYFRWRRCLVYVPFSVSHMQRLVPLDPHCSLQGPPASAVCWIACCAGSCVLLTLFCRISFFAFCRITRRKQQRPGIAKTKP